MQFYSQRDSRWSNHLLGNAPSIGEFGCLVTDFAMIAYDSVGYWTPDRMDEEFTQKGLYVNGDLATDNMLDRAWPQAFSTRSIPGFAASEIATAVASSDTYVILFISTPTVPTHFVIAYSADAKYIVDPWTGKLGTLAGYGGPSAVHKTILVRHSIPPVPTPVPPSPTPVPTPKPAPVPEDVLPGIVHQLILSLVQIILYWNRK